MTLRARADRLLTDYLHGRSLRGDPRGWRTEWLTWASERFDEHDRAAAFVELLDEVWDADERARRGQAPGPSS